MSSGVSFLPITSFYLSILLLDGHRAFVYGDASTPGTLDALPQLAESVHTAVDYPLVVGNGSGKLSARPTLHFSIGFCLSV